jgi:hypothetical protein
MAKDMKMDNEERNAKLAQEQINEMNKGIFIIPAIGLAILLGIYAIAWLYWPPGMPFG